MYDSTCTYFVKSSPLGAFIGSFQHFADLYVTDILNVHEDI